MAADAEGAAGADATGAAGTCGATDGRTAATVIVCVFADSGLPVLLQPATTSAKPIAVAPSATLILLVNPTPPGAGIGKETT